MSDTLDLAKRRCKPSAGGTEPLADDQIAEMLRELRGWTHGNGAIARTYAFPNYAQTLAFANALAWIAHREDHHPEVTIGYDTCRVTYTTHDVGGLSENDFICAAKLDALYDI